MKKAVTVLILLIAIPALISCKLIKIEVSEKRNPSPQVLRLDKNVEVIATGATKISKSDFFPSSFQIKWNGKLFYFDPIAISDTHKVDYIFISHAHLDHFSIRDIKRIAKPEAFIFCPKKVSKRLRDTDYHIKEVKPGYVFDLDAHIKIEAIEAYNLKPALLWLKAHPKSKQNVGYILNIKGVRIYHAGDTEYIPEMEGLRNISLALVPIGGDNLTMDVKDASRMVNRLKPAYVVPMHYEMNKRNDLEQFVKSIDKNIQVRILE